MHQKIKKFYLGICDGYAKKERVLEELCEKNNIKLIWAEDCEKTFKEMKDTYTITRVLVFLKLVYNI